MSRNKQLHAWAQIDAGGVAVPVVVVALAQFEQALIGAQKPPPPKQVEEPAE